MIFKKLSVGVLAAAVVSTATMISVPGGRIQAATEAKNADDLLVVDCLLPGRVRKLGSRMTFLTARRPIKTTAVDCEIRGGEYTSYDRADYATALKIWLPQAQEGDPDAQNYVGEIYEKGLGLAPDYQVAANWYRKAAEAGNSRAQINLGNLYEKGLGVSKDPKIALSWYRKASGLGDAMELDPGGLSAEEADAQRRELESLRAELRQTKEEATLLRKQLGDVQDQLKRSRSELSRREASLERDRRRLEADRSKLEQERVAGGTKGSAALDKSQLVLDQRAEELERREREVALLKDQIERVVRERERYKAQIKTQAMLDQEVASLKNAASQQQTLVAALRESLEQSGQQLEAAKRELIHYKEDTQRKAELLAQSERKLQTAKQKVSGKTADTAELEKIAQQRKLELERQKNEVERLQQEISRVQEESERYKEKLAAASKPPVPVAASVPSGPKVAMASPTLEIIEPALTSAATRSRTIPTIFVPGDFKSRKVVGRVDAPAGLLSLTVNERSVEPNDFGVFELDVPLESQEKKIAIAAIDQQGKKASVQFKLAYDLSKAGSRDSGGKVKASAKPSVPNIEFGKYYALVIGNDNYTKLPKLETAVKDAKAVASILHKKYGFETITLYNGTRYETLSKLNELREKLTSKDNLLIYYAGHGELDRVNQRGHWLPVDAEPDNTANWISNVAVTDILNVIAAKQIMIVADSCYSAAFTRSALGRFKTGLTEEERVSWLRNMVKKRARTILTSGGLKPVLDSGGGEHSVFAQAFLEALEANDDVLEGRRLYEQVSARVAYDASNMRFEQVPEYAPIKFAGHEGGEFFLVPQAS